MDKYNGRIGGFGVGNRCCGDDGRCSCGAIVKTVGRGIKEVHNKH